MREIGPGEWMAYAIDVAEEGDYLVESRIASARGHPGQIRMEVDGRNLTGTVEVPTTGGWQAWQTLSKPGIHLTPGKKVMRVVIESSSGSDTICDINWVRFTRSANPAASLRSEDEGAGGEGT